MNNIILSKSYKLFGKRMLIDKNLRDTLISFEEILNIKKNIRLIYGTDDPSEIEKLIGKKINNVIVSNKDYDYALIILNAYNDLYKKCKDLLVNNK